MGDWTRQALWYFPNASFLLFEPQDELKIYIADIITHNNNIIWHNQAVSNKEGSARFTIAKRDDSSTLRLSEDEAREAGLKQMDVKVTTIDSMIGEHGGKVPEMIKIDAEGFDLKVLEGAVSALGTTEVFFIEAGTLANFDNSLTSVLDFMNKAGYRLVEITDLNNSPENRFLWLVELVFLRAESALFEHIQNY